MRIAGTCASACVEGNEIAVCESEKTEASIRGLPYDILMKWSRAVANSKGSRSGKNMT